MATKSAVGGSRKPSSGDTLASPPPLVVVGVAGSHALSVDDGLAKCFSSAKVKASFLALEFCSHRRSFASSHRQVMHDLI